MERETFYENDTDCTDENPSGTQRRKISSEFSPLNRAQHLQTDLGSANFAEWLVDSSSKGSDYNLGNFTYIYRFFFLFVKISCQLTE